MVCIRGAVLVLAIAAAGAAACRPGAPPVRREPGLNVLLITIDTLRADALGAYRSLDVGTPWMDRLAAGGVRFANARAHNVVTLPSHANLLSGRLPPDHGVRDNAGFRFPANVETLATILKSRGYRTGAFVSAFPLESRFGLTRGFDVYDDRFAGSTPRPVFLVQERRGIETVNAARKWIDAGGDPWFCWVHLYEPHFPYAPAEPFATRFQNAPYQGEVAAADAALAPLLGPVLDSGQPDRTLVVLTSDHGEALGDHGESTHGVFAYEAVLKVPLIIYAPRLFQPAVSARPVGHVDVMPTILDALSLEIPGGLAGGSLLSAIAGRQESGSPPTYFESLSPALNRRWAPLHGVVDDGRKYIELPLPELYDLRTDPGETRNLVDAQPETVARLRRLLDEVRRADRGSARTSENAETRERLRSLGYLAPSTRTAPAKYTDADDPKRLIEHDATLHELTARYLDGDVAGALALCRELVGRRPDTPLWLMHLALLERESGNLDAGIDALRRVIALTPDDQEALALLGAYLTEAGRAGDAVRVLDAPAARPEATPEVQTTRALALARLGRFDEALAAMRTARQRNPANAMTLVEIGTVHLMRGDRAEARRAFEEALAIDPQAARAHSSLGVLAVEDGRPQEAREHWRAATSADPREHEKVLGLGIALARAGRPREARACFEFFVQAAPPSRYARDIERAQLWLDRNR